MKATNPQQPKQHGSSKHLERDLVKQALSAIKKNNPTMLTLCHQKDSTIFGKKDENGLTVAHHAATSDHSASLRMIIKIDKVCLTITDRFDRTPLHYACSYNQVENYNLIQSANSELISRSDNRGMKPIHYAAENGCIDILANIFTNKCESAQSTDNNNNTIAHYAAKRGHLHVLDLISIHMFALLKLVNLDNKNIADLADENNHPNLVVDILDKFIIMKNLSDQPKIKDKMVKTVSERKAKAKAKSKKDSKTFFQQLVHSIRNDTTEEFKIMYANKSICSKETDTELNTLAHHAAQNGKLSKLKYLLSQDSSLINAVNIKNETPTHIVAKKGHVNIFYFLFQTDKKSVTAVDMKNKTPLEYMIEYRLRNDRNIAHFAAEKNDHLLIKSIVKIRKELLTQSNFADLTPAHIAVKRGKIRVLNELFQHEPTLFNKTDKRGFTLAHHAAHIGNLDVLKEIKKLQPDALLIRDYFGNTIAHIAKMSCKLNSYQHVIDLEPKLRTIKNHLRLSPESWSRSISKEIIRLTTNIEFISCCKYFSQIHLVIREEKNNQLKSKLIKFIRNKQTSNEKKLVDAIRQLSSVSSYELYPGKHEPKKRTKGKRSLDTQARKRKPNASVTEKHHKKRARHRKKPDTKANSISPFFDDLNVGTDTLIDDTLFVTDFMFFKPPTTSSETDIEPLEKLPDLDETQKSFMLDTMVDSTSYSADNFIGNFNIDKIDVANEIDTYFND